jgi:NTP pyrophosphatase (non-canonical NTP hydrolase)
MNQVDILNRIIHERKRQDILHPGNKRDQMLSILIEEVGEVGTAIQTRDKDNLKEELVHVAATAVRWLELL